MYVCMWMFCRSCRLQGPVECVITERREGVKICFLLLLYDHIVPEWCSLISSPLLLFSSVTLLYPANLSFPDLTVLTAGRLHFKAWPPRRNISVPHVWTIMGCISSHLHIKSGLFCDNSSAYFLSQFYSSMALYHALEKEWNTGFEWISNN